MRLVAVVGSRVDWFKLAPLFAELEHAGIATQVAAVRPADSALSATSASDSSSIRVPEPMWVLPGDSGSTASVGEVALWGERLFREVRPDAVLVCGDTAAAVGLGLTAARAELPVIHLEAGLRSGDLRDLDEIDRVLISRVAAMHLTPTERALENLEDEGIEPERIHFVGSTLAEAVLMADGGASGGVGFGSKNQTPAGDVVAIVQREENLVDSKRLAAIVDGLGHTLVGIGLSVSSTIAEACVLHGLTLPPTAVVVNGLDEMDPVTALQGAAVVVTDSGDVAEAACVLCVSCVTVRPRTERESTLVAGANRLVHADGAVIRSAIADAMALRRNWLLPKRWDQAVSGRIVRALRRGPVPLS
jgi:UDP-N-acetylglucosamine 2-epimerase